jgi:hypothetical protein
MSEAPAVGQVRDIAVLLFLFVEGDDLDDGPRHPSAISGCLLAIADLGVAVVRTRDPDLTRSAEAGESRVTS